MLRRCSVWQPGTALLWRVRLQSAVLHDWLLQPAALPILWLSQPPACRYAFALTSCVLQASYLLLVERSGADKGLGPLELMLYVSLLSLPFLIIVSLAS